MASMLKRVAAMEAARDEFNGQPLIWGRYDCAKLAAFVARQLGHKVRLSRFGTYTTEAEAKAALQRAGFADLADVVNAMGFQRIRPAEALPGDLVGFPPTDPEGLTALAAVIGNGRVLGAHESSGCFRILQPVFAAGGLQAMAWRL